MMYDQVLSNPDGGELQDRVENFRVEGFAVVTIALTSGRYFLAWSNSVRRDLEALGVLDSPSSIDALLGIDPAAMTDEQPDATLALMQRQQAGWASAKKERR